MNINDKQIVQHLLKLGGLDIDLSKLYPKMEYSEVLQELANRFANDIAIDWCDEMNSQGFKQWSDKLLDNIPRPLERKILPAVGQLKIDRRHDRLYDFAEMAGILTESIDPINPQTLGPLKIPAQIQTLKSQLSEKQPDNLIEFACT